MLGLCSSGARALVAASWSSNSSEEMALAPMTRASESKSRSVPRRNPRTSLIPNNTPAISNATPLVNMVRNVSLALREVERRLNMQPPAVSGFDDLRQLEHLGTDGQSKPPGRVGIDFKPDSIVLGNEIDNTALLGKAVYFAHAQHPRILQLREQFRQARFFRGIDEHDLALVEIFGVRDLLQSHCPAPGLFAVECVERCAEFTLAHDADGDRAARRRKGIFRPVDVVDEIVEIGGFDFVFAL